MEYDLHKAAEEGTLDKIPKEYITLKGLLNEVEGNTVFHVAAYHGTLNQIPKQYLAERILGRTNGTGHTSFHSAAKGGNLKRIPKEFLTLENLNVIEWEWKKDNWIRTAARDIWTVMVQPWEPLKGDNCFHYAAREGKLEEIPKEFLTPNNLLKENLQGNSPLLIALREIEDISGKEESVGLNNPQMWIPYLRQLKNMKEKLDIMRRNPKGLSGFIKGVEALKKVQEMESLKM